MIRRIWKNLFAGFEWSNPFDWIYLVIVISGIVIVPACIATFFVGGWFILCGYICVVDGMKPDGPGRDDYQREIDARNGPPYRGSVITEKMIEESNYGNPPFTR